MHFKALFYSAWWFSDHVSDQETGFNLFEGTASCATHLAAFKLLQNPETAMTLQVCCVLHSGCRGTWMKTTTTTKSLKFSWCSLKKDLTSVGIHKGLKALDWVSHWLKVTFSNTSFFFFFSPHFHSVQTWKVTEMGAAGVIPPLQYLHCGHGRPLKVPCYYLASSHYHSNFHCWVLSPGTQRLIWASVRPVVVR